MSGVTLHCFLRKNQEETVKKEATQKKTRTEREKGSCIKDKTGTTRKKRSHVKGKSKAGSKEKIFEKKERRIQQKTSKKNEEAEVLNKYFIM